MGTEQHSEHGPARDGGSAGSDQSDEPVWRYQAPPSGSGTGAGESNTGHYTPNAAGHGGGIVSAPAESNVNAPGQPLSGAGSATDPAGGTIGAIQASRQAQATVGAAGGAHPGAEVVNADSNLSGSGDTGRD